MIKREDDREEVVVRALKTLLKALSPFPDPCPECGEKAHPWGDPMDGSCGFAFRLAQARMALRRYSTRARKEGI